MPCRRRFPGGGYGVYVSPNRLITRLERSRRVAPPGRGYCLGSCSPSYFKVLAGLLYGGWLSLRFVLWLEGVLKVLAGLLYGGWLSLRFVLWLEGVFKVLAGLLYGGWALGY